MTNSQDEKKVKTFAKYSFTVSSHLTPDELLKNFDQILLVNDVLELRNISNDSTQVVIENIELDAVEWIDEEEN